MPKWNQSEWSGGSKFSAFVGSDAKSARERIEEAIRSGQAPLITEPVPLAGFDCDEISDQIMTAVVRITEQAIAKTEVPSGAITIHEEVEEDGKSQRISATGHPMGILFAAGVIGGVIGTFKALASGELAMFEED